MSLTPDELLQKVQQGDSGAIAAFLVEHRLQLLSFIEKQLGPALRMKVEPDDIVQEVSLSAIRSPQDFAVPGRDPLGLLFQMAEQRIVDAHRKFVGAKKRSADREVGLDAGGADSQSAGFAAMLIASITSPSQAFSRNQKEFQLQQAMQELPAEQRDALRLRYVEGLPTKEIAERLGKSDGAIRVLLSRTINQLQSLLGQTL